MPSAFAIAIAATSPFSQAQLTPASASEAPAASFLSPVRCFPSGSAPRRTLPAAVHPGITASAPVPIAIRPHIARAGRAANHPIPRRRRPIANIGSAITAAVSAAPGQDRAENDKPCRQNLLFHQSRTPYHLDRIHTVARCTPEIALMLGRLHLPASLPTPVQFPAYHSREAGWIEGLGQKCRIRQR